MKTFTRFLLPFALLLTASLAWAGPETGTDKNGIMLNGYDAVAYFTEGKAVEGNARHTATHDGATYHFANAEHREAFVKNPSKYTPAYGGYCAYGTSLGKKFLVNGKAFDIVDGVLYVNKNEGVYKTWKKDKPGNIAKAESQWPKIRTVPAKDL